MITSEQKEELYRFLCKKINYGVHPINDIAQLLADNHISSRDFGYGRLKTMLRDIPEFLNLLPPETGSEEMRVRFSIWQPPKAAKPKQKQQPKAPQKTKTVVLAGKTRRARAVSQGHAAAKSKTSTTPHHSLTPKLPEPPESQCSRADL